GFISFVKHALPDHGSSVILILNPGNSAADLLSAIVNLLRNLSFQDYQGVNTIAWKSIPLALFVTQRGWLYALPVGLLLLYHWRDKFLPAPSTRPLLPFWLELAFYATMPLFHLHTFIALSIVLACLFLFGNWDA